MTTNKFSCDGKGIFRIFQELLSQQNQIIQQKRMLKVRGEQKHG
jgi:hypothetical protein